MAFIHHVALEGYGEACGAHHDTATEARDCLEEIEAYANEPASCPVCDAYGCGADGHGCRQYEWGTDRDRHEGDLEEARAAMAADALTP